MKILTKFAAAAALATAMFAAPAALASDQTELLDHANRTVDHLKSDPAFSVAAGMIHRARAVLIVPRLVKGGFHLRRGGWRRRPAQAQRPQLEFARLLFARIGIVRTSDRA